MFNNSCDRCGVCYVHLSARKEDVLKATGLADSGDRAAKGSGCARDDDSTAGCGASNAIDGTGGIEAILAPPPSGSVEHRMVVASITRKCGGGTCQSSGPGGRRANVKCSRLVVPVASSQKRIPVLCAKQGPNCDGADVSAKLPDPACSVPYLEQPPHLIIAGTSVVSFGHDERQSVSSPGFPKSRFRSSLPVGQTYSDCFDICITLQSIPAVKLLPKKVYPLVQIPFAGEVVIYADHVRRTGSLDKVLECRL
jgi:hypothetical protein